MQRSTSNGANSRNGDYLAAYGNKLIKQGYEIVPIEVGSKAPGFDGWQKVKANARNVTNWLNNGHEHSGVGILTAHTPAIDLDIYDKDMAERIEKLCIDKFGAMPIRVGKAPKRLLVFRTDEPFKKLKTGKFEDEWNDQHEVEILGEGQQFVAYAIHKDTGLPYKWTTDIEPINTPVDELKLLTLDDMKELIQEVIELFTAEGWTRKTKGKSGNTLPAIRLEDDDLMASDGTTVDISDDDLFDQLMLVSGAEDYDTWTVMGMALHHQYDGDQRGLDMWLEWSETADNFEREACLAKWPTFAFEGKGGRPVTARYILKLASEARKLKKQNGKHAKKLRTLLLESASDIQLRDIKWIWVNWIAAKLILLAGAPGTGKTTLALSLASVITRGDKWPDASRAPTGVVVIWSSEDEASDTLAPRLKAMGADLKNVKFISGVTENSGELRQFDPATDSEVLLKGLRVLPNVKLIIIDPIVSAIAGDSHKNAEVRRGLQPIVDLAAEIGAAVIGITHFTKGTGGKDTTERVTGSLAFAALARIVLATAKDAINGGYILTRSKSNLGPDGGGFKYDIEQVTLKSHPDISASRIVWGDFIEGSAKELIKAAEAENVKPNHEGSVEWWLSQYLANGPRLANEVIELGKADGFSRDRLNRAKDKLRIKSKREGFGGAWWWLLDGQTLPSKEDDEL